MPNPDNVAAPVTLIGPGRSGTTLVTQIFARHPEFQSLGETANLVFSTYFHIERSLPFTGALPNHVSIDEAARDSVYQVINHLYPSSRRYWFQKPIRSPAIHGNFPTAEAFGEWYWRVSRNLFPKGRFFTVLREPKSVVVSSMIRWGYDVKVALDMVVRVYGLILHPDSRVTFGMPLDRLTDEKEAAVRELLDFAGVPFHRDCLKAFDVDHAKNQPASADQADLADRVEDALRQSPAGALYRAMLDRFAK